MHADGAQHAVIDHDNDQRRAELNGGGQFLGIHHEAAVTGKADHASLGLVQLGGNRGREPVTVMSSYSPERKAALINKLLPQAAM